ncbi:MAG: Gfo/Idh/MocA family oxidoreductase [Armatimonadetes bacterium]|nr:Gfo/Idh/MocA family oxidoreductase [Armatimonadota bacterium]
MKVAVIGCGGIGKAHALAWQQVAGAILSHVVDRDRQRAEALAAETGAAVLTDLNDLPDDVTIVSVTTDPSSHAPLAEQCLRRGWHVFCEKPLGMTTAEGRRLLDTSRETGRALSVGFKMRYEPIFAQARELCPEVGDIVQLATTKMQPFAHRGVGEWRPRVGAMFELSVHDFDLISFITGLQPRRVVAAQLSHRLGWEREDGFTALVEYGEAAGGAPCAPGPAADDPLAPCAAPAPDQVVMATLSGCYTRDSRWQGADFCLTVTGERGYLRVLRGDRLILHTDQLHVIEPDPPGNTFVMELQGFAAAVASGAPPPIPAEAGVAATALIDAIWEAGQ